MDTGSAGELSAAIRQNNRSGCQWNESSGTRIGSQRRRQTRSRNRLDPPRRDASPLGSATARWWTQLCDHQPRRRLCFSLGPSGRGAAHLGDLAVVGRFVGKVFTVRPDLVLVEQELWPEYFRCSSAAVCTSYAMPRPWLLAITAAILMALRGSCRLAGRQPHVGTDRSASGPTGRRANGAAGAAWGCRHRAARRAGRDLFTAGTDLRARGSAGRAAATFDRTAWHSTALIIHRSRH